MSPIWLVRLGPWLIVVTTCAAFAIGLANPFTSWDDPLYITNNTRILDPDISAFIRLWNPRDALDGKFVEFFPLRDSVYWIVNRIFGMVPWPFHIVSLLAHTAVSVLVVVLARALAFTPIEGVVAGLLFALHPVHVESVAWVASLKDPLYLLFLLLSFISYIKYHHSKSHIYLAVSVALFVFSLLCKGFAIVMPLLVGAFELTRPQRAPFAAIVARTAPFVCGAACAVGFFLTVSAANSIIQAPHGGSHGAQAAMSVWCLVRYAELLVFPVRLRTVYDIDPLLGLDPRWLAILALALAIVTAALWSFRRDRRFFFLGCWFFVLLAPTLNIIPFPALMADRYLYGPSVAVAIATASGLLHLRPRLAPALVVATLCVYALGTVQRTAQWGSESSLWLEVRDDIPDDARVLVKVGDSIRRTGDLDEAASAYDAALKARGGATPHIALRCHRILADIHREQGRLVLALEHARAAVALNTTASSSLATADWTRLAGLLAALGKAAAAVDAQSRALELAPDDARVRLLRALFRFEAGDFPGGREDFQTALRSDPGICDELRAWSALTPALAERVVDGADAEVRRCVAPVTPT